MKHYCLSCLLVLSLCAGARADLDPKAAQQLFERVKPSLVVMRYTFDGEGGRRELDGAGIVVSDDGLVMATSALIPSQLPDEQITDCKLIVPGDEETELAATFQGRDERASLVYFKAKEPRKWVAIKFEDFTPGVGEMVMTVGLLPKSAGFKPYFAASRVSAKMSGPVPQILVNDNLTGVSSPVFNLDGKAIGIVVGSPTQAFLNDPGNPNGTVFAPPRVYTPASDFLFSLSDPPNGEPLKLPSAGLARLSGISKDVADYYGLKNEPAVQIGDVIPGRAAEKAGLKPGDVIVKLNGKDLERGDEPDETTQIVARKLMRFKVGDEITLSVISEKGQPARDVKLTLGDRPKPASRAKRFFAEDLGYAVRELVFDDTYERKMPADAPGVMVAFVKPQSSAASARIAPGDVVTQLNAEPVTDLQQFRKAYEAFRKEKPKEAVVLEVRRGSSTQVIRIEPPQ